MQCTSLPQLPLVNLQKTGRKFDVTRNNVRGTVIVLSGHIIRSCVFAVAEYILFLFYASNSIPIV